MAPVRSLQQELLLPAVALIEESAPEGGSSYHTEFRFQVLEAAASSIGGYDLDCYSAAFGIRPPGVNSKAIKTGRKLAGLLRTGRIHPSLSLAYLACAETSPERQKSNGTYYTDFRLAAYLGSLLKSAGVKFPKILDPACGSGMLLVATVVSLAGDDEPQRAALLERSVCGADLSPNAIRGAGLSLCSLTHRSRVFPALANRLRSVDSLVGGPTVWQDIAPRGFDLVVGNPPWEKLKLTRHEWLKTNGTHRHYGADYGSFCGSVGMAEARKQLCDYTAQLERMYTWQGSGEHDLYKLFLELSLRLTREGGQFALLVPGGLIRSQGTRHLREALLATSSDLALTVLDNRSCFFSIDTRFKFVALHGTTANGHPRTPLAIAIPEVCENEISVRTRVRIGRTCLRRVRPDLTVPEVRSYKEWRVFRNISLRAVPLGAPEAPWRPKIMREVDMTRERHLFSRKPFRGALPLVEGRMVHQYTCCAKKYLSGTGRGAIWGPCNTSSYPRLQPQFWFPAQRLTQGARKRVGTARVGFCDITGQTNERTLLASHIPTNVVCGNKVPTVVFDEEDEASLMPHGCLGILNSVPFDWLMRRITTTTVNYFSLLGAPFPNMEPEGEEFRRIAELGKTLGRSRLLSPWEKAEARAEIDWRVAAAYGHGVKTLELMLEDFPLFDRPQPPLKGEKRSTITRDFLLLRAAENLGQGGKPRVAEWRDRVKMARELGAVPYVPSCLV